MKNKIICLANSQMFNGRCIAGILVQNNFGKLNVILDKVKMPIWVRLTYEETGMKGIPWSYAKDIKLFDVIEFDELDKCPSRHQTENVLIRLNSLFVDSHHKIDEELLKLIETAEDLVFGNEAGSISDQKISSFEYSLMLVKPQCIRFEKTIGWDGKPQARATFTYNTYIYDLPITDVEFEKKVVSNEDIDTKCNYYFAISLGHELNARYYKLIAGVLQLK